MVAARRITDIVRAVLPALLILVATTGASASVSVANLRCEYLADPIGIDAVQPRLSWELASSRRGEVQTAYRVLVASSAATLAAGAGDLWDSGQVASNQTAHVVYAGTALTSRRQCWWRVQVWDKDGVAVAPSAVARWEMGLLAPSDWTATWIEFPGNGTGFTAGSSWIWHPEQTNVGTGAPAGERYFRHAFAVTGAIASAQLAITADDQFSCWINGTLVTSSDGNANAWSRPRYVDVTSAVVAGANLIAVDATNSGGAAGVLCRLVVQRSGDTPVEVVSDGTWKVSNALTANWQQPAFDDSTWSAVAVAGAYGMAPWNTLAGPATPVPLLRTSFTIAKTVVRARLYATALGLYELRLNGARVGDHVLAPDWTDYGHRVRYQAYDVTAMVHAGGNAMAALLGDGWFSGGVGLTNGHVYGQRPALLAQLMLDYSDGSSAVVVSDGTWKGSPGPILESDLLAGETYDARLEIPGWDAAGFADGGWTAATERAESRLLQAQTSPPVRATATMAPRSLSVPAVGKYTYDLGQNLVGVARLQIAAPAGTTVTLRFAEMLNPDGTVYTANLRGARATDYYTCKGGGTETWQPHFTTHGFRYIELSGLATNPGLGAVTAVVLGSNTTKTGDFSCSDQRLNQLQSNIAWGQRGNFLGVPTDCPQRDERLGWMGDAGVFVRTAAFNQDVAAFFSKWMVDVDDAQSVAGAYADVSPRVCCGEGTAAWADAGVIVPWTIYLAYGDTRILAAHYPAMRQWIEYQHTNSAGLLRATAGSGYGDWLSINANTPLPVLNTAFFAYSTQLVAKAARVLGNTTDADAYDQLAADIAQAFNTAYVDVNGRIQGDTQSDYLMALRFGLLPVAQRAAAAQYLDDDIKAKGWHLSTGFVGVSHLLPVLGANGKLDTAYRLLGQDSFPSWLFSVKYGATTIWERWDGWTPDNGFQDPGMNSFNHYSLGSCGEWMYSAVAGIDLDPAQPGYQHIFIHPRPGGGLTRANASLESIHGHIASAWTLSSGGLTLNCTVPANTTARVYVPATDSALVKEGGIAAALAPGVTFVGMQGDAAVYDVGSGSYAFSSVNALAPVLVGAPAASGTAGSAFGYAIAANNLPTSYTLTGTLPPGLTFNPATGVISGTPTTPGTYNVTVTASNGAGSVPAPLTITVSAAGAGTPVFAVSGGSLPALTVGAPFTYAVPISNGPATFAATGLPPGLSVNAATGVISGTPTVAGTFNIAITASNGSGASSSTIAAIVAPASGGGGGGGSSGGGPSSGGGCGSGAGFTVAMLGVLVGLLIVRLGWLKAT